MANNISDLGADFGQAFKLYMAQSGQALGQAFTNQVKSGPAASPTAPSYMRQIAATGAAGAVTGGASYFAGQAAGGPAGQAVGAAGMLATGAVSMAAAGGPAGIAAAGLIAVAGAAKLAAESAKGFASAASPNGMKSVDKTFEIFSAVVGAQVLPAFVMLGAGVLTAAQLLRENLAASVDDVVRTYQEWKPVFAGFGGALKELTADIISAAGKIVKWVTWAVTGKDDRAYVENPRNDPHLGKNEFGGGGPPPPEKVQPGEAAGGQAPNQPSDPTKPKSLMGRYDENLKLLAKDVAAGLGGNAGGTIGGVEEAWKKAQQAAMGANMDKQLLQIQVENSEILNRIAGNTDRDAKKSGPTVGRDR
jgi:hypothetical protein